MPPGFGDRTNAPSASGRTAVDCYLGQVLLTAGDVYQGLPADGRLLLISENTALYSLMGTRFGGNGTTTFALPDLRSVTPNGLIYTICHDGFFPSRN